MQLCQKNMLRIICITFITVILNHLSVGKFDEFEPTSVLLCFNKCYNTGEL